MAHERTLPMLLLNLGGEMVYILEQRLQAQRVPEDKATKGEYQVSFSALSYRSHHS